MTPKWTRRDLLKLGAGAYLGRYEAFAAPYRSKVKISDIQAMALRTQTGNCLIRINTDAGLVGYGEAGATGPMARARIETMKDAADRQRSAGHRGAFPEHDLADAHLHGAHPHHQRHRHGAVGPGRQDHRRAGVDAAGRPVPRGHSDVLARHRPGHAGQGILPRLGAADQGNAGGLHRVQEQHRSGAGRAGGALRRDADHAQLRNVARGLRQLPRGGGRRNRHRGALPQRTRYAQRHRRGQGRGADESAVHRGCAELRRSPKPGWRCAGRRAFRC